MDLRLSPSLRTLYGCGAVLWSIDTATQALLILGPEKVTSSEEDEETVPSTKVFEGCLSTDAPWTSGTLTTLLTNATSDSQLLPN